MAYTAQRAQEIIEKRSRISAFTQTAHRHQSRAFLEQWDRHLRIRRKTKCIVQSYVTLLEDFLKRQEQLIDKDVPPIGCHVTDRLFLTALNHRLKGQCIPMTFQPPCGLDPQWYDILHHHFALDLFYNHDEESFTQRVNLLDQVFAHADSPVFPKIYVTAIADLLPVLQAYAERDHIYHGTTPYAQTLGHYLRALQAAICGPA